MAAEIRAVDLDHARQLDAALPRRHYLAEFVREHKGRAILAAQITAELECTDALRPVDKDCNGEKVIPDRPLAIVEDGPRRDAELMVARAAFPDWPCRERIDFEATAFRAVRLSVVIGPADALEHLPRFIIRHARDDAQGERPCGCGKEEMLGHGTTVFDAVVHRI